MTARGDSMRRSLALAVAGVLVFAAPAWADREHSNNNTSKKLREAVTVAGIMEHEYALQDIATFTGGNRLSGTAGYDASADYVAERAAAAGLEVSRQTFDYDLDVLADYTPPVLSVTAGGPARAFVPGIGGTLFSDGDFGSMYASPSGRHDRARVGGRRRPRPRHGGEQHERLPGGGLRRDAAGRDRAPAGRRVVLARHEVLRRAAARRRARSSSSTPPGGTWINVTGIAIPSVAATARDRRRRWPTASSGRHRPDRAAEGRLAARHVPDVERDRRDAATAIPTTSSSSARTSTASASGPGINDNGSGSATILEIAEQMPQGQAAQQDPLHLVRRRGARPARARRPTSTSLPQAERDKIAAMLNFDMVGSPNFVRFVYDGDLSDSEPPAGGAPAGSAEIEQLFLDYFAEPGARDGADGVRRPLGLRAVHLRRHPGRRPVHRRRGHQDRGAGRDLRRHGGRAVRPVLPPRLRRHRATSTPSRSTR